MSPTRIFALLLVVGTTSTATAQSWDEVASLPGPGRHHPVTFSLGGYGYAATGTTTTQGISDDFYRYDPIADSWSVLADFPGPDRSYAYGGAFNGKGYLGFGIGAGYLADLWQYDPDTMAWTVLAPLPGSGRTHPAFVITDEGKIFVGMGGGPGGNLKDWWEYDIVDEAWTRKADLPGPARHHPYYFNIGKYAYVGLGHGAGAFRDFYRFDPDNNTWTRLIDFPGEGRVGGTQFSFGSAGYIASGLDAGDQPLDTGEFWTYQPTDDSWTQLTPHPGSARWAPGTFIIDFTVYLVAGESTVQMERNMWKYDLVAPASTHDDGAMSGEPSFILYPNPVTHGEIQLLDLSPVFDEATVSIMNLDGRRLMDLQVSSPSATIQVPRDLAAGTYYLAYSLRNGTTHTRQIVVLQ